MSTSENNFRIDYVEFACRDLDVAKKFYAAAFGWRFNDWGPGYTDFHDGRITGGFYPGESTPGKPSGLVVVYAHNLEDAETRITNAGGRIGARHDFPGGRRFHFTDPNGLELAVWSDRRADGTKIE